MCGKLIDGCILSLVYLVESRKKILDWLSPIDYAKLQSDTLRKRQEGTGEWFLKTTAFTKWVEGKQSPNTLFCPGIPGAGKTMIVSIVINHLKTSFLTTRRAEHIYIAFTRDRTIRKLTIYLLLYLGS